MPYAADPIPSRDRCPGNARCPRERCRRAAVGVRSGKRARHDRHDGARAAPQPDHHQRPCAGVAPAPRRAAPSTRASATAPKAPTRGSAMISNRRLAADRRQQPVRAVGQAVEMQAARHRGVHRDGDHRCDGRRPQATGHPPAPPTSAPTATPTSGNHDSVRAFGSGRPARARSGTTGRASRRDRRAARAAAVRAHVRPRRDRRRRRPRRRRGSPRRARRGRCAPRASTGARPAHLVGDDDRVAPACPQGGAERPGIDPGGDAAAAGTGAATQGPSESTSTVPGQRGQHPGEVWSPASTVCPAGSRRARCAATRASRSAIAATGPSWPRRSPARGWRRRQLLGHRRLPRARPPEHQRDHEARLPMPATIAACDGTGERRAVRRARAAEGLRRTRRLGTARSPRRTPCRSRARHRRPAPAPWPRSTVHNRFASAASLCADGHEGHDVDRPGHAPRRRRAPRSATAAAHTGSGTPTVASTRTPSSVGGAHLRPPRRPSACPTPAPARPSAAPPRPRATSTSRRA